MGRGIFLIVAGALATLSALSPMPIAAEEANDAEDKVLIIAHRGASGERPEHTLASYERAIDLGADYIEPDLVVTKDLVLVARHENELSGTTDVANREEFEDRRREKTIEGRRVAGWFAEDFTLAELRSLRAKERVPAIRPANTAYNGLYQIPTFAEVIQLAKAKGAEKGRVIGIYPELKHPTVILQDSGIDMVDLLVRDLRAAGMDGADAPVFVQIFEVGPLQRLKQRVDVPLILLIAPQNGPYDEPELRWSEMMTPAGLAEISQYADGIGPWLGHVLNEDGSPTDLVANAHAAGLKVHPWTLRKENGFMPASLRNEGGDAEDGQYQLLWRNAIASGADGFFTDNVAEFVELIGREE